MQGVRFYNSRACAKISPFYFILFLLRGGRVGGWVGVWVGGSVGGREWGAGRFGKVDAASGSTCKKIQIEERF